MERHRGCQAKLGVRCTGAGGKPAPPRETASLALAGALVATWVLHRVVRAETRARLWFAGVAATALFLELWMAHAPALEPAWKR